MSTNLSKIKRDKMLDTISKIKENVNDEETLKNLSLIEYELTKKKYGLVWEEHEEKVDEELKTQIPTFEEVKDKEIVSNKEDKFNFLLEGDNLHSLYLLEKTHKGKIDVIYIDPPYNTGNKDFIYNDQIINNDDGFRHSKWLSFMEHRLRIAKELLSEKGVIFISIDDNELAPLRMLCDELFDERNFVGCICRATGTTTGQDANKIGSSLDYCLVYSKTTNFELKGIPLSGKDLKRFKDEDEKGKYSMLQLRKTGNEDRRENRPNMFYPVIAPDGTNVYPFGPSNYLSRWRVAEDTYNSLVKDDMIVWKKKDKYERIVVDGIENSPWTPYVKYYADGRTKQVSNLFQDIEGNKKASLDLKNIVGKELKFDYPKPVEFLNVLLKISSENDSTILDFFAGSGTTGQAVLELNQEDNGNRRFILCTNNENNICEDITYQRLKTVITGKRKDNTEYSNGISANLKYLKTSYVPRLNNDEENIQENLLVNIKNLIQLENGISVDNEKIRVILDEEEIDTFSLNLEEVKKCEKLYISTDILLTAQQVKTFKDNNVEVYVIPEYYFENEIKEVQ